MGEKKCVLVLGCRTANLARNRALKLEDLEVLAMRVVSSLNASVITQMLCEVASIVGKIISICSDRGSEIIRGVKDFQATEAAISSVKMGIKELQFADEITEFLLNQSKGIKLGECFIGPTEVLESLFGKIKYMEREQRAFGFTSLLLAAMAAVGPLDEKTIAEAMRSVKVSQINEWGAKEIGQSVQSQRRQIKKIVAHLLAKVGQKVSWILERIAA
jgi:hypothetical protein